VKRIVIVLAILGAGVAAFVGWRARTGSPSAPPPSRGDTTAAGSRGDAAGGDASDRRLPGMPARLRPATPGGDGEPAPSPEPAAPAPAPGGASVAFEQEVRDSGWAVDQERELTLRLERLIGELAGRGARVDIDGIECRRTLCKVAVHAPDSAALGKLYGALETPDGLYGWADAVLLSAVDTGPDGQVTTSVLAMFERD